MAKDRHVIIDTDPGVDDALAILFAFGARNIVVEGLTIVCGNGKDIATLGANARLLLSLANYGDTPVSLGKTADVALDQTEAAQDIPVYVHGRDGLGNVAERFGRSDAHFNNFHSVPAAQFIVDTCRQSPGEITLVCVGPLSNIKDALELCPELPTLVQEIVIMGGAVHGERRGNRTPAAEANFACDPESADKVFSSFSNIVLADLGITHQTNIDDLRQAVTKNAAAFISDSDQGLSKVAEFIFAMCEVYIDCYLNIFKQPHAPAHDVVAMMYVVHPELFVVKQARVEIEVQGKLTRGMSVADWGGVKWKRPVNCSVLTKVDASKFVGHYVEAIGRLPRQS